ncbi:SERTA domain-containing protein 3-like [Mugil cephalus]|uniref:SERTA domain-containing protein 3-like n=1 Tax=Mugil cephalus TaxID=48193 RepID=UPI001FB68DFA|nr:SERTA domain-containing protein 3-like [Mugil cephalus]
MLGRGVKRKWSCLEELEAEVMEEKQQIGKEEEEEDEEVEVEVEVEREDEFLPTKPDMSHLQQQQQRQRVLGLCLEKLQRYQAGMELSLRRSVLLINTLRQIQEEMRSDEGARAPDAVRPDSCLLRDDFREDVSLTCPGCAEGEVDGEKSPELPSQEVNISAAELQKPPPPPPPPPAATVTSFSDAVNAMGYLSDLTLDDIFDDIDTSMYETSDLPSAWSSGSLWPVSVSLWPDEDAKVRPGGHSSAGSLQSCLLDLNDLDHIMEILVKS